MEGNEKPVLPSWSAHLSLQLLHIHLSVPLVAGPVWAGGGTQDSWGRDGLPKGRLSPQKPLAGSAAGGEHWQRAQSDARAEASGAAPAMSSNHLGWGALLSDPPTHTRSTS